MMVAVDIVLTNYSQIDKLLIRFQLKTIAIYLFH